MSDTTDETDRPLRYRLLTGPDDHAFCERVSAALDEGYTLYGSPGITWKDGSAYVAQAIIFTD